PWPVRLLALPAFGRPPRLATPVPAVSAIAARTHLRPMSTPTTQPATGFSSYNRALGPRSPRDLPTSRTRPPWSNPLSASDTVGFDSPLTRATWARERGPCPWIRSSTVRSLIARRRLGVPTVMVDAPRKTP